MCNYITHELTEINNKKTIVPKWLKLLILREYGGSNYKETCVKGKHIFLLYWEYQTISIIN